MIKTLLLKIKQALCSHEFSPLWNEKYLGTTLNWSLQLTKEFEDTYMCCKCGKEEQRRYIYFGGIKD